MKMTAALYSEIILVMLISLSNDLIEIIKDFVVLGFILEIDDYFAKNMSDFEL